MRELIFKIRYINIAFITISIMFFPINKIEAADRTAEFLNGQIYNNLISDADFIDTDSMSEQQIQDFLVANNSYLKDYKENCKTAARIIFEASNGLYDAAIGSLSGIDINSQTGTISPKVILVMLQKEQSLVTTQTYDERGIRFAMGYGCPDATGCSTATHLGFSEQVGWGSWQLRYNYEYAKRGTKPAGFITHYIVGENSTFTDYNTPYNVTFGNASTASIYSYTPHVFDSAFNFWDFYSSWNWSSPASPAIENTCPASTPARKLGKVSGDGAVDSTDLSVLADQWNQNVTPDTGADFDKSGFVDSSDLSILADQWGK